MASAAKNLIHNLHHSDKRSLTRTKSNHIDQNSEEAKTKREEDKHLVASWDAGSQKMPLSPGEVAKDPEKKAVGKSSKHLRCEDFKLITTLGTGTLRTLGAGWRRHL